MRTIFTNITLLSVLAAPYCVASQTAPELSHPVTIEGGQAVSQQSTSAKEDAGLPLAQRESRKKAGNGNKAVAEATAPPFVCDFADASDLDMFTIIDANRDYKMWEYNDQQFVALMNNPNQPADDYLVSPGLTLQEGYFYTFSVDARPYRSAYPEKLELLAGATPDVAGLTETVLSPTILTEEKWLPFSGTFRAPADGTYYFAVHGVSDPDMYALLVNTFSVSGGISGLVSAAPEISVTRNPDGEPSATIDITAPSETLGGEPLTSISEIRVSRDGELIKSLTDVEPNGSYSFVDDNLTVAEHTWTVECVNDEGAGLAASASCFTGIYYAVWPETVTARIGDNEGQVILDWTPCLVDQNGNPLRADQVTYEIYRIHASEVGKLVDGLTEPHYADQVCGAEEPQREVQYTVMARTSYGLSAGTGSGIFYAGAPYELPFNESFANGALEHAMWSRGLANYAASWELANMDDYDIAIPESPADDDNGFAYHRAYNAGEQAMIGTAKVRIPADAVSATLEFHTFLNGAANRNELEVSVDDNGEVSTLCDVPQSTDGDAHWEKFSADLLPFAGKTIRVRWKNTVNSHILTCIDNIKMFAMSSGVAQIDADNDIEAASQYFNLQGMPVDGSALSPGVYVRLQGDKASKVVIK